MSELVYLEKILVNKDTYAFYDIIVWLLSKHVRGA